MIANPKVIDYFSKKTKCWSCKHRFKCPVLLPVTKPIHDKFQPNYNIEVLFHLHDTHGIPEDILREWIIGSIYGQELTEFGIKHETY